MKNSKALNKLLLLAAVGLGLVSCAPGVQPTRELTSPPAPPEVIQRPAPTKSVQRPALPKRTAVPKRTLAPVAAREVSQCVSPDAASKLDFNAGYEVASLNADTSNDIAMLEYLVAKVDPNYECGTVLMQLFNGTIRSVRVYRMSAGASKFDAQVGSIQSVMQQTKLRPESSVVVLADFEGLLPKIIRKTGWDPDTVSGPKSPYTDERALYTSLASSNRTTYVSSYKPRSTIRDIYNCSDFSSQAAAQAFFRGLPDDVNGLDGDNDGYACESLDNSSGRYRVILADIPTRAPVAASSSTPIYRYRAPSTSSSSSSGRCYVNGYTRSNGTKVSGYYRSC